MANSPLLQIPQVAPNQTNKETTINDGFSIMERSLNDVKQIDMAGANVDLNITDYTRAFLFELSGHTTTRTLTVPPSTRLFSVFNDGTSTVTIEAKDQAGLTANIPSGAYCVLFNNAVDIRIISNSQASGQVSAFLSLPDTPNSFAGHAGHAMVVNEAEDAITFGTVAVSFPQLTDTPANYSGAANKVVRVNPTGNGLIFAEYVDRFLELTDAPGSYVSQAGRMLVVNSLENSVEFADIPEAVIQATRTFTLPNSSFETGDLTGWITPTTSGAVWAVDHGYSMLLPFSGSYLAYFATGQGDEPASIAYEVDLTGQAYPDELDDDGEIVVEIAIGSTDSSLGGFSIDFFNEFGALIHTATSAIYAGGQEMTLRRFKTDIPVTSRTAIIYINISSNPDSADPTQLDFAIDSLAVQLKLSVDQIVNFTQLFDVPHDYAGQGGKVITVKTSEDGLEFVDAQIAVSKFTDLTDVPNLYTSQALKHLRVNAAANGIEFAIPTFLQLGDTPSTYTGAANRVARVNGSGTAVVFTEYKIATLMDVDFTTAPTEGQVLIYDSDINKFKPGTTTLFPSFTTNASKFLRVKSDETSVEWAEVGNASFPVMTGNAARVLAVNSAENGVEWVEQTGGGGGGGGGGEIPVITRPSIVQYASAVGTPSTVTLDAPPTLGNYLVLVGTHWSSGTTPINGWVTLKNTNGSSYDGPVLQYLPVTSAVAASATLPVPFNDMSDVTITVFEVTDFDKYSPFGWIVTADPASATANTCDIVSDCDDALVLGSFTGYNSTNLPTVTGVTAGTTTVGSGSGNGNPRTVVPFWADGEQFDITTGVATYSGATVSGYGAIIIRPKVISGTPNLPDITGNSGKVLKVKSDESGLEWGTGGGGGGDASYPDFTDNAGKVLAVNTAEDSVEWVPRGIDLTAFGVSFSTAGTPEVSELLVRFLSPGSFSLPVGLTGSFGYASTGPTGADVDFDIQKNGVSIGTMSFANGSSAATFSASSITYFNAGDRLDVVAPSLIFGILDVSITFIGSAG